MNTSMATQGTIDAMRRTIHRSDANQLELIALARKLGMHIEVIGRPTDCVATINGRMYWLEIKNPEYVGKKTLRKNAYTDSQQDFIERCALSGAPMLTWRTTDDVLACYEGQHTEG